jgi:hypothetical protein
VITFLSNSSDKDFGYSEMLIEEANDIYNLLAKAHVNLAFEKKKSFEN